MYCFQSNTKLDLTEQLQAERVIGKKLNAQLNDVEQQMEELKEQLTKKEATLHDLEKEKLHAAQIEDQIQHYQAQSHSASTLQQELQKALVHIYKYYFFIYKNFSIKEIIIYQIF